MATATVYLTGVVSTSIDVEYEPTGDPDNDREAALEVAYRKNRASLCHQCSEHMNEPGEWVADSWTLRNEPLKENVVLEWEQQ
jgi:hypothetical protein